MVASEYSLWDMENHVKKFKHYSIFRHSPKERVWFYETLSFEVVIVMVKDEKI